MTDFRSKVALVTGASSGMGAETARILSERGARVFAAQRSPSNYEDILADFTEPNSPEKVIDVITRKTCLLYTSPSPRDLSTSRMPSSA